jgi:small subunit ribosomal protein S4e
MKNHLKRIATPRTWIINRKEQKFIIRPNPGAHSFERGLPLAVIMRDLLKLASTMGEVKKILNNKDVLVDGKRRKNPAFIVGLFDVISFPDLKKSYRSSLDDKGRLVLTESPAGESAVKLSKVVGKTVLKGGKIQFNLHDGKNIISKEKAKVGDSLLLGLPKLEIKKVLPLKIGMKVFLTSGKYAGDTGVLKEIKGTEVIYSSHENEVETAKDYLFVVGDKKTEIKVN